MHRRIYKYILTLILCLTAFATRSEAQFKEEAFQQTYNEKGDSTARTDTTDKLFSFKDWAGGITHKHPIEIGTMFAGSVIMPGTAQIYNKDYWNLPIVYGGIGALAGTGGYYLHQYNRQKKAYTAWEANKIKYEEAFGSTYPTGAPSINPQYKTTGTWLMVGAGLVYWGSLLDGVVCYESDKKPDPGKATWMGIVFPGGGQIYNHKYWKLPIVYGGFLGCAYALNWNNQMYSDYSQGYLDLMDDDPGTASYEDFLPPRYNVEANRDYLERVFKNRKDNYRRQRDLSIFCFIGVYLISVIDAYVDAELSNFDISEDLTVQVRPSIIDHQRHATPRNTQSYGLQCSFSF